ncbi:GNAT family N-acetyltransferase [Streptomyces subrutilus]|uniref:GNAT family N-acetyltransferase n=1 Tax=Streptomyces subrutilus TaxID=36818 RepID=UPI001677A93F|nr:GNAT family N-acetyltransferase [Streptomyces subrutilus]
MGKPRTLWCGAFLRSGRPRGGWCGSSSPKGPMGPRGTWSGCSVRDGYRGAGVADGLCRAALEWAWSLEEPVLERVRLFVHRDNPRAAAFYRRFGFVATGAVPAVPAEPSATELEYAYGRP